MAGRVTETGGIERWQVEVPGLGPLAVFAARFPAAGFDPAGFARCGLDCPPHIARSVPKRQAEYLHGRLAAIGALRHIGRETRAIPTGAHREPVWPAGTVGSITHTAGLAAAVALPAARGVRVGIDLERLAEGDALTALAQTVVSASEMERLAPHPTAAALTAVFSAKESFYKAAFAEVGRFFDFDALAVDRLDPATGSIGFTLRHDLTARLRAGGTVNVHHAWIEPSLVLTVCALPSGD